MFLLEFFNCIEIIRKIIQFHQLFLNIWVTEKTKNDLSFPKFCINGLTGLE